MRRACGVVGGCLGVWLAMGTGTEQTAAATENAAPPRIAAEKDSGYRGIWFTLGQKSEFGDKYSGGLGTYTANHVPMAIYSPVANKTFFVYGGTKAGKRHLLAMASYYDHHQKVVPRPTIVHDKQGVDDPHDNPSLAIDGAGHLWVFISGRARLRPGLLYRSVEPYSVDRFEQIAEREMTYPQPRWIDGQGFLYLFTKYTKGRELYWSTSPDGRTWEPERKFAGMGGHYQTSHLRDGRVITAFNMHPGGNVDRRTNLYFLQSNDFGKTWSNARGEAVAVPLVQSDNAARVRDYQAEKRLVYIHDLDLDAAGHPLILYITSADHRPGPGGDPRWWTVAHFTGKDWEYAEVTRANHNYSTGSLYREDAPLGGSTLQNPVAVKTIWRILGPTQSGPQPVGAGGELAYWISEDSAKTWRIQREVTCRSPRNHNYVRRPMQAHPDFYAFWADGNPDTFSPSSLYFTNQTGDRVWRLPTDMPHGFAAPELVHP